MLLNDEILWPAATMPEIRFAGGFHEGVWTTIQGVLLEWADFSPDHSASQPTEVDVAFRPLRCVGSVWSNWAREDFVTCLETSLDTCDAAMALGSALLDRLMSRFSEPFWVNRMLVRAFFGDRPAEWTFSRRPDVELLVRMHSLLDRPTWESLDFNLSVALGSTALLGWEESRTARRTSMTAMIGKPVPSDRVAFPPLIGDWGLHDFELNVTLQRAIVLRSIDLLGYETAEWSQTSSDGPRLREECLIKHLLEPVLPPHLKLSISWR